MSEQARLHVVGVRFSAAGRLFFFDAAGLQPAAGDRVLAVVEGVEQTGRVALPPQIIEAGQFEAGLPPLLRVLPEAETPITPEPAGYPDLCEHRPCCRTWAAEDLPGCPHSPAGPGTGIIVEIGQPACRPDAGPAAPASYLIRAGRPAS